MGCCGASALLEVHPDGMVPSEVKGEQHVHAGQADKPEPEALVGADPKRDADWVRLGGEELEEALSNEWVKLVRADWLVQHCESGGVLARRQEMPPEAYIGLDELKQVGAGYATDRSGGKKEQEWLRVMVLSYPWLQPGHPDPHGENLHLLAVALKVFVNDRNNGGKPYGVLIDFTALFQAPRSTEETEVFMRALPALNVFYSHPETVVLKITQFPAGYPNNPAFRYVLPEGANTVDYAERGWCFAESSMSGLVKSSGKVLDLGRLSRERTWLQGIVHDCQIGRSPPLHPSEFKEELNKKTFTSKKADFDKVNKLYSDAFERHLARATELDYHGMKWGADAVEQLLGALRGNTWLQRLNLRNNLFGDQGALALAGALKRNIVLSTLDVSGDSIGPQGTIALADALGSNRLLLTLNLHNNQIGVEGAVALAAALESNNSLQTLNLRLNVIGDQGAVALAKALETNSSLQTLVLGSTDTGPSTQIGAQGAISLGKGLEGNRSLQELALSCVDVGDQGAMALAKALENNSSLRTLSLYRNDIGEQGAVALGRALEINRSLQALNFIKNDVGDQGAVALGKALESHPSLVALDLWRSHIGDEGAAALGKALESNSVLQTLDLKYNDFGDLGAVPIAEAFKRNGTLRTIDLRYNRNISSSAKDVLREAARARPTPLELELS